MNNLYFSKVLIPYYSRNQGSLKKVSYNVYGYPACPNDVLLFMKYHSAIKKQSKLNGDVLKYGITQAELTSVIIPTVLLKRGVLLTQMKTWSYICFLTFSTIPKNEIKLTKLKSL